MIHDILIFWIFSNCLFAKIIRCHTQKNKKIDRRHAYQSFSVRGSSCVKDCSPNSKAFPLFAIVNGCRPIYVTHLYSSLHNFEIWIRILNLKSKERQKVTNMWSRRKTKIVGAIWSWTNGKRWLVQEDTRLLFCI